MRLSEIVDKLGFEVLCGPELLSRQVSRGYASDLMSDVIAHGESGDVWLTMQVHMNVVAVAAMKEIAAVVLSGSRRPEDEVINKAKEQEVVLLVSELSTFEIAGRLYSLGISGT